MSNLTRMTTLVLMAGLAAPAFAQDSTSRNSDGGGGLPGDAMDAYSTVLQKKNYVATLSPITTSQGTTFGIVPLIKGSKACSVFFNNLVSAQSISQTILNDIDATGTNYLTWGAPQLGIHPTENAPGAISVSGPFGKQFGVTFNEGSGGTACLPSNESQDNVITGLVNFDPAAPAKMYVQRVIAGVNKTSNASGTLATGSLSVGGVDASTNTGTIEATGTGAKSGTGTNTGTNTGTGAKSNGPSKMPVAAAVIPKPGEAAIFFGPKATHQMVPLRPVRPLGPPPPKQQVPKKK